MSFSDWTFHTTTTGPISDFVTYLDFSTPFVGSGSLLLNAIGASDAATVAFHPDTSSFDTGFSFGRIQTVFEKKTGNAFRDNGIYFLCNASNPLAGGTTGYFVAVYDGAQVIRVYKFTEGIHGNNSGLQLLHTFTNSVSTPIPNSTAPCVLQVDWFSGGLISLYGGVKISVSFKHNTTDFNQLIAFGDVIDSSSPFTGGAGEGLFCRSRSSSESLAAKFDETSIYQRTTI